MMFNQGVTGTFNYGIGTYFLISSMAGILFLGKHNARAKILQAGLFVSLINIVVLFTLQLIQNTAQTKATSSCGPCSGSIRSDGMCGTRTN